jgi:hypothetical protein
MALSAYLDGEKERIDGIDGSQVHNTTKCRWLDPKECHEAVCTNSPLEHLAHLRPGIHHIPSQNGADGVDQTVANCI